MKPSIGRIVHVIGPGGVHLPAILICEAPVPPDLKSKDVWIMQTFGFHEHDEAREGRKARAFSENNAPGTWHWPERVDG